MLEVILSSAFVHSCSPPFLLPFSSRSPPFLLPFSALSPPLLLSFSSPSPFLLFSSFTLPCRWRPFLLWGVLLIFIFSSTLFLLSRVRALEDGKKEHPLSFPRLPLYCPLHVRTTIAKKAIRHPSKRTRGTTSSQPPDELWRELAAQCQNRNWHVGKCALYRRKACPSKFLRDELPRWLLISSLDSPPRGRC